MTGHQKGAAALRPGDDSVYRELALARAKAEETARAEAAEARANHEAELRRKRDEELAVTRVNNVVVVLQWTSMGNPLPAGAWVWDSHLAQVAVDRAFGWPAL